MKWRQHKQDVSNRPVGSTWPRLRCTSRRAGRLDSGSAHPRCSCCRCQQAGLGWSRPAVDCHCSTCTTLQRASRRPRPSRPTGRPCRSPELGRATRRAAVQEAMHGLALSKWSARVQCHRVKEFRGSANLRPAGPAPNDGLAHVDRAKGTALDLVKRRGDKGLVDTADHAA